MSADEAGPVWRDPPRVLDGEFDLEDLRAWVEWRGEGVPRMIGDGLVHLGIRDGDILVEGEDEYRVGGVVLYFDTDFDQGPPRLFAVGQAFFDEAGDFMARVGEDVRKVDVEIFGFTSPALGFIPVTGGRPDFSAARTLPAIGPRVSWDSELNCFAVVP